MKLPFLRQKTEEKEFFLALIFSERKASSLLFEKTGEKLLILASKSEEFEENLESLDTDRLIELSDVVISDVEQKLPQGSILEKTIFAVPHSWIVDGKITKDYLSKLKKLCEALHLTPIGFIVSIEAITAYLHKKEGVPVTAIFAEIEKKHVVVSIVKNGEILLVTDKEIENESVTTVEEILKEQTALEVLPSKIILLNFEHAKKIQQVFLSHTWNKSIAFLHIPQVVVLETEIEAEAVISGVALQMGFDNLTSVSLPTPDSEPVDVAVSKQEIIDKPIEDKEEVVADDTPVSEDLEFSGDRFGFYEEVDVITAKVEKENADGLAENSHEEEKLEPDKSDKIETDASVKKMEAEETSLPSSEKFSFGFLSGLNINIFTFIPSGKSVYLYPVLAAIILILLTGLYYYFIEKVRLTVFIDKQTISKNVDISFSKDKNTSFKDSIVHITEQSIQEEGKEEGLVTGKKETGDKAKGEVIIYNKTDAKKTFSKGTVIEGTNKLNFSLTEDVNIASTSSFSTSFSSSKGKVEASKFGKEYNLPSGTNFSIGENSTSDYFAKNDQAFSGGTKKEIKAVSQNDLDQLTSKAIKNLSQKAMTEAQGKKGKDEEILPGYLDYTFDEKSFSKKQGEEASNVSLTAKITYILGVYDIKDLKEFAKNESREKIKTGLQYSDKDSKVSVSSIKTDDKTGEVSGKLVFRSVFLPPVSASELAAKIAGKSESKVEEIIGGNGISDQIIVFTRSVPFMPKIIPFNKNNIEIVIKTK